VSTGLQTIYGKAEGGIYGRCTPKAEVLLYMQRELKEYRIILVGRDGKRIQIPAALQLLGAKAEEWNNGKLYVLSDALFFIHNKRHGVNMKFVMEFGTGFFLGMMFQRLITNRGIDVQISERTITAAEMDEAIKEIGQ